MAVDVVVRIVRVLRRLAEWTQTVVAAVVVADVGSHLSKRTMDDGVSGRDGVTDAGMVGLVVAVVVVADALVVVGSVQLVVAATASTVVPRLFLQLPATMSECAV